MAEERKVCVVTGSSSGIGAATVKLYAKQGWNVVVNYSREAAPAEAVASECRELGADVLVARADIAADADCRRLAGLVEARFGRADVLVNNAGTTKFVAAKDLDGLDADDFQRIYAVNVIGAFQMVRAFAPLLGRQPGAAIVNVSSIASLTGNRGQVNYSAAKGALNSATKALALELASRGITVNAVAPGIIDTGMAEAVFDRATIEKLVPMKRAGTASEVAALVAFLASDEAAYISGQIVSINGAMI